MLQAATKQVFILGIAFRNYTIYLSEKHFSYEAILH